MKEFIKKVGILVIVLAGCGAAIAIALREVLATIALLIVVLVAAAIEEYLYQENAK